ncbi:MAG: MarR family winged helix-turn-helix transcriptional regulator [Paracoccaceae bacterium]
MSDATEQHGPELAELMTGACYCLATRRASRRMIRTYDAALAGQGLTISQLATLAWVKGLRKPTVQKIADLMEMDQSALSRGLVPLDRDGLISSSPDAKDKRKRVLALTAKGETALTKGAVEWAKAQRQIEEELAARGDDLARLLSGINALAVTGEQTD